MIKVPVCNVFLKKRDLLAFKGPENTYVCIYMYVF